MSAEATGGSRNPAAAHLARLGPRLRTLVRTPMFLVLLVAQLIAVAVVLIRMLGWLQPAELLAYDDLRVTWAENAASDRLFLIGINDRDIARWGWPLRDEALTALLERVLRWHPRAIGVDLYRDVPVPPGTDALVAFERTHNDVFWPFKLSNDSPPEPERLAADPALRQSWMEDRWVIRPPAAVRDTDRAVLADTPTDPGGIVRRALLFAGDRVDNYPSMGMALAEAYLAREHIALQPGEGEAVRLGKAEIKPLDDSRGPYVALDNRGFQVLLDYHGGPKPFPIKSLAAVMDGDDLAPMVRDRVVLIGIAAESVKDLFATPFSTGFNSADPIFGVEVHAHMVDQLLRQALDGAPALAGLPRPLDDAWIWLWAMAGALVGAYFLRPAPALIAIGGGVEVIGLIVYAVFGEALLLPFFPAVLAWTGAAIAGNQVTGNHARTHLRKSFEHYLPPAVIARMVKADVLPKLGGERREISVLFTDVAGFTTFSESMDPEALARLTNQYFAGVCAAIFAHDGLANAFIGDGVLAIFGAPQDQPDHADRAVAAALEIARFERRFRAEQQAKRVAFGRTRIGVHTGFAFVGNIGARQRLQYTALGDVLNTASRLEGLNKAIGTTICTSGEAARKAIAHRCRPVGSFVVKGRHGVTEVFEPIDPLLQDRGLVERYQTAFAALAAGRPEVASLFAALAEAAPDDPCILFHCNRLQTGQTGVLVVMEEK